MVTGAARRKQHWSICAFSWFTCWFFLFQFGSGREGAPSNKTRVTATEGRYICSLAKKYASINCCVHNFVLIKSASAWGLYSLLSGWPTLVTMAWLTFGCQLWWLAFLDRGPEMKHCCSGFYWLGFIVWPLSNNTWFWILLLRQNCRKTMVSLQHIDNTSIRASEFSFCF